MKKFKYTLFGQQVGMLTTHACSALVFAFLWFVMAVIWTNDIGRYIYGTLGCVLYFLVIYNAGTQAASKDKKSFSECTPKPQKGIFLPILLTVVNILVIILYKYVWHFFSDGMYLTDAWAVAGNVVSILWFSAYKTFLGMERGHIELQGYIIIFVLPFIASAVGYYAGYKGFDLYGKLDGFMYEKNKKRK